MVVCWASHWVSGARSALASSVTMVAQFKPEASPEMARLGDELVLAKVPMPSSVLVAISWCRLICGPS
jgi:hypothetical protein